MIQILRVLYIALVVFVIFNMVRRGGCCGGHRTHNKDECENNTKEEIYSENESSQYK